MSNRLKTLKSETQLLHDHLEQISYANKLMDGTLSLEEYQNLIYCNWLIFGEIEPFLNELLQQDCNSLIQNFSSQRLSDLNNDLALSLPKKSYQFLVFKSIFVDKTWTIGRLIGLLYVIEGSRLGGKVIVKALKKNPALNKLTAFHFYAQDGIDVRQRWLDFMQVANKILTEDIYLLEAIESARQTFQYFISVFENANSFNESGINNSTN